MVTTATDPQEGKPLLQPIMKFGKRSGTSPTLNQIREYAATELAILPDEMRQCRREATLPVRISSALQNLARVVDARHQVEQG